MVGTGIMSGLNIRSTAFLGTTSGGTTVPAAPTFGTITETSSTFSIPLSVSSDGGSAVTSYSAYTTPDITLNRQVTDIPLSATSSQFTTPTNAIDGNSGTSTSFTTSTNAATGTLTFTNFDFTPVVATDTFVSLVLNIGAYFSSPANRWTSFTVTVVDGATTYYTNTFTSLSTNSNNTQVITVTGMTTAQLLSPTLTVTYSALKSGTTSATAFVSEISAVANATYAQAPQTSATSPVTIPNLVANTSYTISATATNAIGTSNISTTTKTSLPSIPIITSVTATSATTVSIAFTGGSGATSFTATASPTLSTTTTGAASPLTVTGTYVAYTAYTFTVTATSSAGSVTSSSSSPVTPNGFVISGGTLYSDATYYYRKFTASGTLTLQGFGSAIPMNYWVVGGGGGGGIDYGISQGSNETYYGGGGGGGGFLTGSQNVSANQSITIGTAGSFSGTNGTNGGNSIFSTITATGGGGGGGGGLTGVAGASGGSGGGGGATNSATATSGGTRTASPVQGNSGGSGGIRGASTLVIIGGGSGGGIGSAGSAGAVSVIPAGGSGTTLSFDTTIGYTSGIIFSRGGNGGFISGSTNSVANTGQGGHGQNSSYPGGSGVVVIRYLRSSIGG